MQSEWLNLGIGNVCDILVTRFWKVLRQINPYVSNKWPLKLPCAYLNTQESRHTGTPLKWNMGG
ncbi:hypothetical protein T03_13596 [Trichinella britovi]|uniref:Uncharacterized protein n=1 Tax=Trichinella britovi TaxID=45882 RepID=A0A0V1CTA8_TRIBR|nr:hypothetical protein T03_13596 [Trichinella britovi]